MVYGGLICFDKQGICKEYDKNRVIITQNLYKGIVLFGSKGFIWYIVLY